jgi:exonuclease III
MMAQDKNKSINDVNDSIQSMTSERVAFGRGGSKAPSVVIKRNPCTEKENIHKEDEKIRIGTWNVRTMLRPGKLANVIKEMRGARLDVLGLSEIRWKEEGDFMSEGIRVIHTEGLRGQNGVAILLNERVAKCVSRIERHEDRLLMVTIKAHPVDIVVMQVYMPTTAHPEEELDKIYEMIEERMGNIKGTDYLVIMGDWNAAVGEGAEGGYIGKYGLGKRNERGERLVEFCRQQELVVTNTCFQHEKRRRYTWKAPGDIARYQLDYIMVRKRYRNSVKNSRTLPGADADTDHNLVAMTVHLCLRFVKRKGNMRQRWDKDRLKAKRQELSEKIDEHLTEGDVASTDERWKRLKETIIKDATEIVGFKKGTAPRKPWVTTEMLQDMVERRKWKHQSSEEARQQYRRLNNQLRRTTDKARERW